MRACIYGAGAMGTVLGALVARAGRQIDLITRNSEHVAALNANGARVTFSAVGKEIVQKVTALTPDKMTGKYDVIFLMTKQRGNAQTVTFLKDYLAEGGVICTTQNGLPEYSVAEIIGEDNTLGCAVSWGATFVSPGHVLATSSPDAMTFSLGSPFGRNPKVEMVEPYLSCAGRVEVEDNFAGARWSKLIVNSAFSSLSAITSLTFGQIAKDKKCRAVAQALLKEGMDTALACGVTPAKIQGHDLVKLLNYNGPVKKALSFALIPVAMKKHKNLGGGMYYDLVAGRKCDMQFVLGVVEKSAQKAGIAVPVSRAVLDMTAAIEKGEKTVSPDNMLELIALVRKK